LAIINLASPFVYNKNNISEHLFYIGITSDKNIYFREKNHRTEQQNKYKLNIINKYDFNLVILWSVDTKNEAEEREEFLIRWFGDQLCNICKSAKDLSHARSKLKKPKSEWKKHSLEHKIANRDRNLTIKYEKVIQLIEEWAKNPLETQQDFANRKGISRSKFKDWIRLYKPEYIGLTKRKQKEIFNSIENKNIKTASNIIKEFSEKSGLSYIKSKGIYYKFINKKA
jgi:hypothetical protein